MPADDTSPMEQEGGTTTTTGRAPRLPYYEWLRTLDPARAAQIVNRQHRRQVAQKRKYSRIRKARYYKRKYGGYRRYGGSRPLIVSAGTARGLGSYGLSGNISGSILGQSYNLGGFYKSEGTGAYNVKQNSLLGSVDMGGGVPKIINTKKGEAVVISHCEYLGDLFSGTGTPTDFHLQTFALNPGNSKLFPWAAKIAHQFEEYELRGCMIQLRTLSSEFAANLSMGSVFMAANYNASQPPPVNKMQLENYEYANSRKPSESLIMPIECAPQNNVQTHMRIADDEDYEGQDKLWYDWCNIYIGSQGIPTAETPIAEIWICYEIALFKPWVPSATPAGDRVIWAHLKGTNPTASLPLGTTVEWEEGSSEQIVQSSAREITMPTFPANWQILYIAQSASGATGQMDVPPFIAEVGTGAEDMEGISNSSGHNAASEFQILNATETDTMQMRLFKYVPPVSTVPEFKLEFGNTGTFPDLSFVDLYICTVGAYGPTN